MNPWLAYALGVVSPFVVYALVMAAIVLAEVAAWFKQEGDRG